MTRRMMLLTACLAMASSAALAEEKLVWQLYDEGERLTIVFGIPDTDYAEINVSCKKNTPDLTLTYVAYGMPKAKDGLKTTVALVSKGSEYRIPVVGSRSMMDDAFILEGNFRMEAAAKRLFEEPGRFTTKLKGEKDRTYSFDGFRTEIRKLLDTCR